MKPQEWGMLAGGTSAFGCVWGLLVKDYTTIVVCFIILGITLVLMQVMLRKQKQLTKPKAS